MDREIFGVMVVDDEPNIRSGLAKGLAGEADLITTSGDAEQALNLFRDHAYQLVIVDIRLNCGMTGFELLERFRELQPRTMAIVITAHAMRSTATSAMCKNIVDVLYKPLDLQLVRELVRKVRERRCLRSECL